MSIEAINWALNLKLAPSQKLVTIVLGNYSNDEGICWPSFETIAKKTSLSRRSVIQQINALKELKVLRVVERYKNGSNLYHLNLSASEFISPDDDDNLPYPSENNSPAASEISSPSSNELVNVVHQTSELHSLDSEPDSLALVNVVHQTSELHSLDSEPDSLALVNVVHPNHQLNHHRTKREPSTTSENSETEPEFSPCPHQKIINLYHRILPTCPRVLKWTENRKKNLKQRWSEHPNLELWQQFFEHVSESPFLIGKVVTPNRKPFVASLGWLVKAENFAKVLEGNYHDKRN